MWYVFGVVAGLISLGGLFAVYGAVTEKLSKWTTVSYVLFSLCWGTTSVLFFLIGNQ